MKKANSSFLFAAFWFIITVVLLTLPGSALPKEDWLDKIWFDKWIHILLFFLLVVLWSKYGSQRIQKNYLKKKFFIWIAIIALIYGTGMEFVQKYFIKNRSFDIGDILADVFGCGIGLIYCLMKYIKKINPCRNRGRNQN